MFENVRKSWRLKGRLDDVEGTLDTVGTTLRRHIDRTAEEVDLLRLEVQRLRGRVVGGVRNTAPDIGDEQPETDYDEIDRQIRDGTYKG